MPRARMTVDVSTLRELADAITVAAGEDNVKNLPRAISPEELVKLGAPSPARQRHIGVTALPLLNLVLRGVSVLMWDRYCNTGWSVRARHTGEFHDWLRRVIAAGGPEAESLRKRYLRWNHSYDTGYDLLEQYDCSCGSTFGWRGIGPVQFDGDGQDE